MTRHLRLHRGVPADVEAIAAYLFTRHEGAALRFPRAVMETAEALLETPGVRRIWRSADLRIDGVRSVVVRTFPNHLWFHRQRADAIEVMLVIYGGREWQQTLGERSHD